MLAAEKFSSPLQIVILLLNLITHRTKCDAGRACNPSLLTISTSLRMQFKAAARTKLVAPLLSCASNARTTASGFDMMDECVSVSRTCVLHGDAFLWGKSCTNPCLYD
jgi:hypothetical protein